MTTFIHLPLPSYFDRGASPKPSVTKGHWGLISCCTSATERLGMSSKPQPLNLRCFFGSHWVCSKFLFVDISSLSHLKRCNLTSLLRLIHLDPDSADQLTPEVQGAPGKAGQHPWIINPRHLRVHKIPTTSTCRDMSIILCLQFTSTCWHCKHGNCPAKAPLKEYFDHKVVGVALCRWTIIRKSLSQASNLRAQTALAQIWENILGSADQPSSSPNLFHIIQFVPSTHQLHGEGVKPLLFFNNNSSTLSNLGLNFLGDLTWSRSDKQPKKMDVPKEAKNETFFLEYTGNTGTIWQYQKTKLVAMIANGCCPLLRTEFGVHLFNTFL